MSNYNFEQEISEFNNSETVVLKNNQVCSNLIKNNDFNIFQLNIRSLAKNFDELIILLNCLHESTFDVIVLSETFQIMETKFFNISNFTLYYNNGNINRNDGVVVYINNKLNAVTVTSCEALDTRIIRIKFKKFNRNFGISAVYRSHDIKVENFVNKLPEYLVRCNEETEVFVGDVNIDILNTDRIGDDYLNFMAERGFRPMIVGVTREWNNSKTCIDHIFVRTGDFISNLSGIILQTSVTDHYSTVFGIRELQKSRTIKNYQITIDHCNEKKIH